MSPFSALSDFATQSTIYKRHENRHLSQQNGRSDSSSADTAVRHHHHPSFGTRSTTPPQQHQTTTTTGQQSTTGETFLSNLVRRSTIYKTHQVHHQEMKHDPHAGAAERHMTLNMAFHHDGVFDALFHIASESSIFDRNSRRNEFLHA